ncbi:hypothetical protein Anae109_2871 [Anaeromyxobacter sp. Fw109-5]|nr:hypothetical protein Anae109_2871 [Anaeromyxobacter sp. Fw109-5]
MTCALSSRAAAALAASLIVFATACGGGGGASASRCDGATWTGDDPAADRDGDGLLNADECAGGLDPARADTDGDGALDGAEVAAGTDPADADTDDDGLADGAETSQGTDPKDADTDGDELTDGAEVDGGTDPTLSDTDADGLADGDEGTYGTDPRSADSDSDGLGDGDEIALGYDPADPTDPPSGGVCGVLAACARDALAPVHWAERAVGDFRLALPGSAATSEVAFTGAPAGRRAAVGFDLRDATVAGFLLSMDEPVAGGSPAAQLDALAARLAAATGAPWTGTEPVAGRAIQTWDGFPAIVSARVNLTGPSDLPAVRLAALAAMAGLPTTALSGLPSGATFGAGTDFVLGLEVVSRENAQGDAKRVVVVAAIAPKAEFDARAKPARLALSDLSGGTAIGQSGDGESTRCEHLDVASEPKADFVWMSDISASTDDERGPIAGNARAVFTRLEDLGIDFRMGVVKHTSNSVTDRTPAGQLLGAGFTRDETTFAGFWSDVASSDGQEYGLTAVDDVIGPAGTAVPRTATEEARKVREGVKLVVVYVSDEHAQEVERTCSAAVKDACNNPSDADYPCADLTGNACIAGAVQPFIDTLAAQDAIAFGIIAPPPGGCATSYEVGWGYAEAIQATGGSYGSVCASDPGQTLDDIVNAVAGASSSMKLTGAPIALTLKVVVTPANAACAPDDPTAGLRELARSQVDGFDYDPVSNTIFFVGPSRPQLGDTVTVSYREWVDRTANPDPDGTDCCGGCNDRMWCNVATCKCQSAG